MSYKYAVSNQGNTIIKLLFTVALIAVAIVLTLQSSKQYSLQRSRSAANATVAAAACKAFAEAEDIYHRTDYNGDGVLEYCTKMTGATSLATHAGVEIALVDRAFAAAEGTPETATPKAGYLFRILTAQGKSAPGGAYSYMENGRMTKGYAFVAYPAEYDKTGRDCFMISNAGTIYQADLGPNTTQIVWAMTEFDPVAPTWTPTE